jgi:OOP family OmpA-OmpF porin
MEKGVCRVGGMVLSLVLCVWGPLWAQYTHEMGVLIGASNYQGDLPEPHVEMIESRWAGGVYYRYHLDRYWAFRANAFVCQISGDDQWADTRSFRKFRFRATVAELAVMTEWKPLARRSNYYVQVFQPHLTPYLFAGVALVWANPRPECYRQDCLDGHDPFAMEVRQQWFVALPYGIGVRYDLSPRFTMGFELGQRPVFNDRLDGVSLSANPDRNDWYIISGLTVSYMIGQKRYRDINYQ